MDLFAKKSGIIIINQNLKKQIKIKITSLDKNNINNLNFFCSIYIWV